MCMRRACEIMHVAYMRVIPKLKCDCALLENSRAKCDVSAPVLTMGCVPQIDRDPFSMSFARIYHGHACADPESLVIAPNENWRHQTVALQHSRRQL